MSWRADESRRVRPAAPEVRVPAARPAPVRGATSMRAMARTLATLLGYLVGIVAVCYLVAFVAFTLAAAS